MNWKRYRRVIWFNPKFCKLPNINIGKYFRNLLDKHFNRDNPLRKNFIRNTVKISYSCTNNMHCILNSHNRRLLDELNRNSGGPGEVSCNCWRKWECSLGGRCKSKYVMYQTCISLMEINNDGERVYKGISAGNWKQGLYNQTFFLQLSLIGIILRVRLLNLRINSQIKKPHLKMIPIKDNYKNSVQTRLWKTR